MNMITNYVTHHLRLRLIYMRFAYLKVLRLISRAGEVSFKRISHSLNFFGGRRPSNQEPCIQIALFVPIEMYQDWGFSNSFL